ncbi:MAG: hypothetical protein ACMXYG_02355 [Candidatus Woesearchaeota archaeon]
MNEKNNENIENVVKDSTYYLGKASACVGPWPLGKAAQTVEEMEDILEDYANDGGYKQDINVFVVPINNSGSDIVDSFLTTHYLKLYVILNKGTLEEGIQRLKDLYGERVPRLIGGINPEYVQKMIDTYPIK